MNIILSQNKKNRTKNNNTRKTGEGGVELVVVT